MDESYVWPQEHMFPSDQQEARRKAKQEFKVHILKGSTRMG